MEEYLKLEAALVFLGQLKRQKWMKLFRPFKKTLAVLLKTLKKILVDII